jgi:hypothetical protein
MEASEDAKSEQMSETLRMAFGMKHDVRHRLDKAVRRGIIYSQHIKQSVRILQHLESDALQKVDIHLFRNWVNTLPHRLYACPAANDSNSCEIDRRRTDQGDRKVFCSDVMVVRNDPNLATECQTFQSGCKPLISILCA